MAGRAGTFHVLQTAASVSQEVGWSPHVGRHQPRRDRYLDQVVQPSKPASIDAKQAKTKGILTEIAEVALLALGLYLVINFAIQTVHVIGLSMYPTVGDQDYLVATKIDYRFHSPERGDIIIMRDPYDASRDFIKRVIGLPGDRILIRQAHVYINGSMLEEPYLDGEPWTQNVDWPTSSTGELDGHIIKPNEYFVMGDNRNHSSDSRMFGTINRSQIEARAWIRVLPFTRIGPIDGAKPKLSAELAPSQQMAALRSTGSPIGGQEPGAQPRWSPPEAGELESIMAA